MHLPPPQLPPTTPHHVALLSFSYLLGSLSPLPQPVEAIAGVQPVVGVAVLTHPVTTLPPPHPLPKNSSKQLSPG